MFITEVIFVPAIALAAAKAPPPSKNKPKRARTIIAAIIPAAITAGRISVPPTKAQLRPSCPGTQAQTRDEFVRLVWFCGGQW